MQTVWISKCKSAACCITHQCKILRKKLKFIEEKPSRP